MSEFKALYELLSLKNSKSPKIDFLLLLLWHLKNIFGEEEINGCQENGSQNKKVSILIKKKKLFFFVNPFFHLQKKC